MQENGCHIWFRPGEKWIPNGLPGDTQLSIQIRYYDENSSTKDREIAEDINPENLMKKYFDFAVLTAKAQDILRKNQIPPNEDYVTLQPETIEKIKNRDPEIIKKLEKKQFLFHISPGMTKISFPKSKKLLTNVLE